MEFNSAATVETQNQIPIFFQNIPPNTKWMKGSAPEDRHRAIARGVHAFGADMLERMEWSYEQRESKFPTSIKTLKTNADMLLEIVKGSKPLYEIPKPGEEANSIAYQDANGNPLVTFGVVEGQAPVVSDDEVSKTLSRIISLGVTLFPQVALALEMIMVPGSQMLLNGDDISAFDRVKKGFADMETSFAHIADMAHVFNNSLYLATVSRHLQPV